MRSEYVQPDAKKQAQKSKRKKKRPAHKVPNAYMKQFSNAGKCYIVRIRDNAGLSGSIPENASQ